MLMIFRTQTPQTGDVSDWVQHTSKVQHNVG